MSETIQAPKYKVGQEVLKPDGKVGKILAVIFNPSSGWVYKVSDKYVDVVKVAVVKGFVLLNEVDIKTYS